MKADRLVARIWAGARKRDRLARTILLPLSETYGVDPIALGVLMMLSQMIGLLTPPVGTVIFVLQAIANASMSEVFWGSLPFLVPLVLLCFGIIFWPDAILYLPRELGL